jgi:hypothetical protein
MSMLGNFNVDFFFKYVVRLICLFSHLPRIWIGSHIVGESCSKLLVLKVCWPWIVSIWKLLKAINLFWYKHFYHCPIYLVNLHAIKRCIVSNLYLILYIYIFSTFFYLLTSISPSLARFNKNVMDMDMVTCCKWMHFKLCYFDCLLQINRRN